MAEQDADRFRRVAAGVRKKLVGMALEHSKKHDDLKHELLAKAADHRSLDGHETTGDDGRDMGSEHAEPGHASAEGEDTAEFRHQQAEIRADDLKGDQPLHAHLGSSSDEQHAAAMEQKDANRQRNEDVDTHALESAAQEPKSGSEAEGKGEVEESKHPDVSNDPDTGEPEWQKMLGKSRKMGKTTKGIIGAYRGGG